MNDKVFDKEFIHDVFVDKYSTGMIFCEIADLETADRPTVQFKVRHRGDMVGAKDETFYNYKDALESLGVTVIDVDNKTI